MRFLPKLFSFLFRLIINSFLCSSYINRIERKLINEWPIILAVDSIVSTIVVSTNQPPLLTTGKICFRDMDKFDILSPRKPKGLHRGIKIIEDKSLRQIRKHQRRTEFHNLSFPINSLETMRFTINISRYFLS